MDGRFVAAYDVKGSLSALTLPSLIAEGVYVGRFVGDDGSVYTTPIIYRQ
jgi:hypothetical protein